MARSFHKSTIANPPPGPVMFVLAQEEIVELPFKIGLRNFPDFGGQLETFGTHNISKQLFRVLKENEVVLSNSTNAPTLAECLNRDDMAVFVWPDPEDQHNAFIFVVCAFSDEPVQNMTAVKKGEMGKGPIKTANFVAINRVRVRPQPDGSFKEDKKAPRNAGGQESLGAELILKVGGLIWAGGQQEDTPINVENFVTLSPAKPNRGDTPAPENDFDVWLNKMSEADEARLGSFDLNSFRRRYFEAKQAKALNQDARLPAEIEKVAAVYATSMKYVSDKRSPTGFSWKSLNSVAQFHLGNGAMVDGVAVSKDEVHIRYRYPVSYSWDAVDPVAVADTAQLVKNKLLHTQGIAVCSPHIQGILNPPQTVPAQEFAPQNPGTWRDTVRWCVSFLWPRRSSSPMPT